MRNILESVRDCGMKHLTRMVAYLGISAILSMPHIALAQISDTDKLPNEYVQLKRIVNKLAKANNLGEQSLIFTIVPGGYAMSLAAGLGLCDKESCSYYGQINPFKKYGGKTDEILRQNYLYGTIEGWAHSTGTVEISHQSFRIYGDREDFLACTVAHELVHVVENHSFHKAKDSSEQARGTSDDQKKLIHAQVSRDYEIKADQGSYEIMTRAGYPETTCLEALDFLHKSTGDGSITSPEDSHPGYDERMEALKSYIASSNKEFMNTEGSTSGVWSYRSDMNFLKFSPIPR